jgi:tellurite resistance protein TerC
MTITKTHIIFWAAFVLLFFIVFTIDLQINRKRKEIRSVRTSLTWSVVWIGLALLYALAIFLFYPHMERRITAANFISGYLTEYSLSVDNLFVFIVIFTSMSVKEKLQPRLLQIGILISIVLRIIFIVFGIALINQFHWILYVFGVILLWTAWKMAFTEEDKQIDPEKNLLLRWVSKLFRIDHDENHHKFFIKKNHKLYATNLFLVLLVIGSTDVVFAVDSIPAVMGITRDPFVVITSNVFALMGLISLFSVLRSIVQLFRFLKYGISIILFFIGLKMIAGVWQPLENWFVDHTWVSLVVIAGCLAASVLLSVLIKEGKNEKSTSGT